ncbi:MAG: hypothetical protein O6934_04410 [SAR324 cluster bacterium]|nr:hypothetical protein [SAR324 cluster bacterium]
MADSGFETLLTTEQGDSDRFDVRLSEAPNSDVSVTATSLDLTEIAVHPSRLVFGSADWFISQTVTVTGLDDDLVDGNQNAVIRLESRGATLGGAAAVSVLNVDNDMPGITIVENSADFSEAGGVGGIALMLNAPPEGDVVVDVTCTVPSEALLADENSEPGETVSLYFSAANWQLPQWVYLFGQEDGYADGDQIFDLSIQVNPALTSDTSGYLDLPAQPARVIVRDDQSSGFMVHLARVCGA